MRTTLARWGKRIFMYLFDFFCAAIFWLATNQWSISKSYLLPTSHPYVSTPFHTTYFIAPLTYIWAPSSSTFASPTLTSRYVVSFGSWHISSLLSRVWNWSCAIAMEQLLLIGDIFNGGTPVCSVWSRVKAYVEVVDIVLRYHFWLFRLCSKGA